MIIKDTTQSSLDTLPPCPVILDGLAACSAAIDCPYREECAEKEKVLNAILEKLARGDI